MGSNAKAEHKVLSAGCCSKTKSVCVCFFFGSSNGDSPSDQGETCTTLRSVSRGLHLFSAFFRPTRTKPGHTEGYNRGFFLLFYFFFAPPSSCGACLHFLSREGFGRPFPSSTMKSKCVYSRSFSAFYSFLPPGTKVRKKTLSPRFEPVTWVPEGTRVPTRPPGRPSNYIK